MFTLFIIGLLVLIIGIIAGGDTAIRKAVENAEDDWEGGWRDMQPYNVGENDVVVGIAASGSTPYVIGAVKEAKKRGILTGCITCNPGAAVAAEVGAVSAAAAHFAVLFSAAAVAVSRKQAQFLPFLSEPPHRIRYRT